MWHVGEITRSVPIKKQKISINTNASKAKENDDNVEEKFHHKGMCLKIIEMEITRNTQLLTNIRFRSCHVQCLVKQIILKVILPNNNNEVFTFASCKEFERKMNCFWRHMKLMVSNFLNRNDMKFFSYF